MAATEETRLIHPGVWFGHRGHKLAGINDFRQAWSIEDITENSFVCVTPGENSEYKDTAGVDLARVEQVPVDMTDDTMLPVVWYQFDP